MKHWGLLTLILTVLIISSCDKDDDVSDRFGFLTGVEWQPDSLLVNGNDASGPGELLENFDGLMIFNEDGTGSFGSQNGTWAFKQNEAQLELKTVIVFMEQQLPITLLTDIVELTAGSLKLKTTVPNYFEGNLQEQLNIRMTFKAK